MVKSEPFDYLGAISEHFEALDIDQQLDCVEKLRAIMAENAQREISEMETRSQRLRQAAGLAGASATEKAGDAQAKSRGPVAPKYRSRANPELVWSGRGGEVKWLTEEMAATGKPRTHFLIDNPTE